MSLHVTKFEGARYNFTLFWLLMERDKGHLVVDPPFQRGAVWSEKQKEAWIETLIGDLPRPPLFVNQNQTWGREGAFNDKTVVIDGRQRIEAIFDFVDDKLQVRGEKYSEQDEPFQNRFKMIVLPVIMSEYQTEKECVELYLRLLTCGTAHTEREIQKAQEMLKEYNNGSD